MSVSNLVQNINKLKQLPSTWVIKNFSKVVLDNSSGNKKIAKSEFLETGKIAIVDQGKELIAGYYDDTSLAVKTLPPYIVFGDHTRIFKYIDFPFVMGADGTKVLQPVNESCETKYLYYFFLHINVPDTGYNRHFKYLKGLQIPLPPLEQQQKIASILDAADTLRQKDKALLAKYDELTQALFLDMFGDIKNNPKNFPVFCLDSICNKITDGEHGTVDRINEGRLYLMARNIRDNFIDLSEVSFISEENHQKIFKRCNAQEGDILLVCVGATIGRMCIMPQMEEFSLARSVALLKPNKEVVSSHFLYSALSTNFIQGVIKRSGNSSAQAGL